MSQPATQTAFDVAFWLLERSLADGIAIDVDRLGVMLHLADRSFAPANGGQALMPACFVPGPNGPREPNVEAALRAGIEAPWRPALPAAVLRYLESFWSVHGAMPLPALVTLARREGGVAEPAALSAQRFTADGRSVQPWRPRRQIRAL